MTVVESTSKHNPSLFAFFLLVIVLTIPFWLFGALSGLALLPGLPVSALATLCPMLAALILMYRKDQGAGVMALLKRSFDFKRIKDKRWYAPILLLMPVVAVLSFWTLRLMGVPVPPPQIAIVPTLALSVGFFVGALGEELGWSGFAIDPMQARWGALKASLMLGVFWAIYHYIALVQASRSLEWIAWWTLGTVALRVIMVWLFNNTGQSVFGAALFHMTSNVVWQLFPVQGSYWDPRVAGIILALLAAIVVGVWGPDMHGWRHRTSQAFTGN